MLAQVHTLGPASLLLLMVRHAAPASVELLQGVTVPRRGQQPHPLSSQPTWKSRSQPTWKSKGTKKLTVKLDLQKGPADAVMRVRTGAVIGTLAPSSFPPSMYLNRRCTERAGRQAV